MSIELLETAAQALGPLVHDLVFLGGASIQIWISDPAAPTTRATNDVDVISAVTTRVEYYRLARRLKERGFSEASDSPVICRWNHPATNLVLDVMPQEQNVLGFSNPWYPHAIETSIERKLPSGAYIKAANPAAIIATKLAAWKGRGKEDMLLSLDLHDILVLLDGRPELQAEISQQPAPIRTYIAEELNAIQENNYFMYLAESAMHPYGTLGHERATRLRRLTIDLIKTAS